MPSQVIEGIVNFNITTTDVFNGQDTGQYSMTITLAEDDASTLAASGVKIKDHQEVPSSSRSSTSVLLMRKVTCTPGKCLTTQRYAWFKLGDAHPVHGVLLTLRQSRFLKKQN